MLDPALQLPQGIYAVVELRNSSTFAWEINLFHDAYCAIARNCECREEEWEQLATTPDGLGGLQRGTRRVHQTVRIAPDESARLHDAVLGLPGIDRAIRDGLLQRVPETEAASPRRTRRAATATE